MIKGSKSQTDQFLVRRGSNASITRTIGICLQDISRTSCQIDFIFSRYDSRVNILAFGEASLKCLRLLEQEVFAKY